MAVAESAGERMNEARNGLASMPARRRVQTEIGAAAGLPGELLLAEFIDSGVAVGIEERHFQHLRCQLPRLG